MSASTPRSGVLVLLALVGLNALFGGRGDRGAALQVRSDAEAAHALATSLLKQLEERTGPGAAEALEDARRRVAYTEEEQADGERELSASSYLLAERQFARALEGYTRACQDLSTTGCARPRTPRLEPPRPRRPPRRRPTRDWPSARRRSPLRARLPAAAAPRPSARACSRPRRCAPRRPSRTASAPPPPPAVAAPAGAGVAAGAAEPPKPVTGTRPVLPDRTAEKRAVAAAISTWNRALNARDWALLQSVQKLRPGQLESYQQSLASPSVRQSVSIRWIAELAPTRFEAEVVIKREERKFFVWRNAGEERRQAIAVLQGGKWTLTGL